MSEGDFATWVCGLSQRTNRSLAGSKICVGEAEKNDALLMLRLRAWGMVPVEDRESADFVWAELPETKELAGAQLARRAASHMPVSRAMVSELGRTGFLGGLRIAVSLVLEPKTSVLLTLLTDAGAKVGVFAPAAEVDRRMISELRRRRVVVEADATWDSARDHAGALRLLDRVRPQLIIDDGAHLARLAALERPGLSRDIIGVAEETTSGVRAFTAMEAEGQLPWPVVNVNDSRLKAGFDNLHGTGETCVTTVQTLLGTNCFMGAHVVVVGFGPVGSGFARRVRVLGADVTVCDIDPVAALRARFEGFSARDLAEVLPEADIVVSATGMRHTLCTEDLQRMHDGAALVVIGGTENEIALDELPTDAIQSTRCPGIERLEVPDGPALVLLAHGDGVNYTVGGGNPIEVMDLSFAVQLAAIEYLLAHKGYLPHEVIRLGSSADRRIACLALEVRGASWRRMKTAGVDSAWDWRTT